MGAGPIETLARHKKARAVADALRDYGCTPERARGMSSEQWAQAAESAGWPKHVPSEATRALIRTMLAEGAQ